MFVVTVDQKGSRSSSDRVDELLRRLAGRPAGAHRAFERTAGDEVQGVLTDPREVVALTLDLVRDGGWSVGVGIGAVREPLAVSTRAGHGPAFTAAREAVTRAKSRPTGLAVRAAGPPGPAPATGGPAVPATASESPQDLAQAALDLLAALVARRTDRGWEAVDLAVEGLTQAQIGRRLGVSKQAVSQRLQAAEWHLEPGGRALAAHVLSEADDRVSPS